MVRALLLSVSLTAWSACYSPAQPACGFFCGPNEACPTDYHCAGDHVCHLDGSPANLGCGPDAGVDTFRFDALPDAVDPFPPEIVNTIPASNAMSVAVNMPVTVTFDEPVFGVDGSTFVTSSVSTTFPGSITTTDNMTFVLTPGTDFPAATEIDVTLLSGIQDLQGNHFAGYFFSFTTQ